MDLADRLAVPGAHLALIVDDAELDQRHGVPLLGALCEALRPLQRFLSQAQAARHTERRRLRHAPRVHDVDFKLLLKHYVAAR